MKTCEFPSCPTVLLVEDEPIIRELIAIALEDLGAAVTSVETAQEGLEITSRSAFSMLLTDVRTPGAVNGLELAYQVGQSQPDTRIVVMSGYHDPSSCALPSGAIFLPKPWTLDHFIGVISDQLARSASLRAQPAA
ncbi:UNVERIFIED_ORG: DNA-binding NtrC family response regulator [Pseudomonas parafulva]|jgi:DNA-binding NtrC family response regulator|uniref:Response regulator n=1 Tax=Pseudomonas fulva TaxID=47880 RepID=A0A2L1WCX4_9PSED|nr:MULTISPECIES: response regulator [Pseudomonas]MCY4126671.1 response regulator [Pseudomonas sp.]MDP9555538.1 DNA-binding NtrC family response regulator [Pseudomonas parafulva]MDP9665249.1 DNA-binding NtrC family response regulator [Pseudomonas cremoricolorata]AVF55278.1 response regulator [Pseudomonas fulva]MBA1206298.1 response regulator [Pseudomonas fulva]